MSRNSPTAPEPSTPTFVRLAAATPRQTRQIIALYRAEGWWGDGADDPDHVARIIAGSHLFIIASVGDEVVAMGRALSDRASDAYIQDVTVKDTYRDRGIGTQVIGRLIEGLHADGLQWIALIAERGSSGFYERIGFKEMPNAKPMLNLTS
jgi:spermidine synthase